MVSHMSTYSIRTSLSTPCSLELSTVDLLYNLDTLYQHPYTQHRFVDIEVGVTNKAMATKMGLVCYVHPEMGETDGKPTVMFSAMVSLKGGKELQSYQMKCDTKAQANRTIKSYQKKLEKGAFMFITH